MRDFVHLHVHTEYSLLDGITRIEKLISTVSERNWSAVAMTDHGNMYGAMQFYKACLSKNVKPIIGTEFYVSPDIENKIGKQNFWHLVLLAKNEIGYKNLLKLNSIAFTKGFYYKPRIDYKTLERYFEGLICLSACIGGSLPQLILKRKFDEAREHALWFKNLFKDDYYFEIQNHGLEDELKVNKMLYEFSKDLGIKLVATNDVHYIGKEDAEMQDILMCVQMGKQVDDPDRLKFPSDEFYLKTYEEMLECFPHFQEALDNTIEIANKCNLVIRSKAHGDIVNIDKKYVMNATENFIPSFTPETGETPFEFMKRITFEGLNQKYKVLTEQIVQRANSELEIIESQGFVEYFLIVWDYIDYARKVDIPVGPGRGSGAGSIVAYAMGITLVDPLKYDLIFERFIHKERVSMPDFDIDFDYDRRGEVIEYVKQKYKPEHVAQIVTFGTMAAKNAIRDVARALKMPYSEVDKITKPIPAKPLEGIKKPPVLKYYFGKTGKEEDKKFIIPELRQQYDNDEFVRKIVDLAIKLEGSPRNCSTHACGVLIAPDDVDTFVPLSRNGEDITTQYNMIELEELGLLKMDFLGLRTLTDINKALGYIRKNKGIEIDFYNMEYNDSNVYSLLSSGATDMVFQLESGGMKKFMRELKPDCLEDIIAGVSLYRPGPMDSIPRYVKNKQNPDEIVYDDPCLQDILKVTYGCIVYQEQVMKIFQVMGGYNMGQADNVRRIMGKKKKDKMPIEKEKFINGWKDPKGISDIPGVINKGISREVGEKVFSEMENFASYAFNKSHAAAYAFLSYQTAYLKTYFEKEFLASVLNNRITNSDEIKKYVTYAKTQKIEVLQPDINKSETYFTVEDEKLRFGLAGLKNVGVAVIDNILKEREQNGKFKDFVDFIERVDSQAINKRCLESLIFGGAFDSFNVARSQLMAVYETIVDRVIKDRKNKVSGQFSLFDGFEEAKKMDRIEYPNIKEFNKNTKLKYEKEIVGVYISGHPLDEFIEEYKQFNFNSSMLNKQVEEDEQSSEIEEKEHEIEELEIEDGSVVNFGGILTEIKKVVTKVGNKEMAICTIEDLYGNVELMFFPNTYQKYKSILIEDNIFKIKGKVSIKDDNKAVILVESISQWTIEKNEKENDEEKIEKMPEKVLYLRFNLQDMNKYNSVCEILSAYKGISEICVKCSETSKSFKMKQKVSINNQIINELNGALGEENVIVK